MSRVSNTAPFASQSPVQRGAVLMVALVIVLAMSIAAASAIQNVTLQERMAGNMQDKSIAFHAAEDALITVGRWLQVNPVIKADYAEKRSVQVRVYDGITNAEFGHKPLTEQDILSSTRFSNWIAHAYDVTDFGAIEEANKFNQEVKVTVELLAPTEYLILAYSGGASGNASVILRSVTAKSWQQLR